MLRSRESSDPRDCLYNSEILKLLPFSPCFGSYFEKLKPSCVDMNLSYEDRVKQREEEIQSLNEALRILDGNDIA